MSWRPYTVTLRMRGTIGGRGYAVRRRKIYATSHEDALTRAKADAIDAIEFSVKTAIEDPPE